MDGRWTMMRIDAEIGGQSRRTGSGTTGLVSSLGVMPGGLR